MIEKIIHSISANANPLRLHVDFSENELGEKGGRAIAGALSTTKRIGFIDFEDCKLKKDGVTAILNAVSTNKEIKGLDVSSSLCIFQAKSLDLNKNLPSDIRQLERKRLQSIPSYQSFV